MMQISRVLEPWFSRIVTCYQGEVPESVTSCEGRWAIEAKTQVTISVGLGYTVHGDCSATKPRLVI